MKLWNIQYESKNIKGTALVAAPTAYKAPVILRSLGKYNGTPNVYKAYSIVEVGTTCSCEGLISETSYNIGDKPVKDPYSIEHRIDRNTGTIYCDKLHIHNQHKQDTEGHGVNDGMLIFTGNVFNSVKLSLKENNFPDIRYPYKLLTGEVITSLHDDNYEVTVTEVICDKLSNKLFISKNQVFEEIPIPTGVNCFKSKKYTITRVPGYTKDKLRYYSYVKEFNKGHGPTTHNGIPLYAIVLKKRRSRGKYPNTTVSEGSLIYREFPKNPSFRIITYPLPYYNPYTINRQEILTSVMSYLMSRKNANVNNILRKYKLNEENPTVRYYVIDAYIALLRKRAVRKNTYKVGDRKRPKYQLVVHKLLRKCTIKVSENYLNSKLGI